MVFDSRCRPARAPSRSTPAHRARPWLEPTLSRSRCRRGAGVIAMGHRAGRHLIEHHRRRAQGAYPAHHDRPRSHRRSHSRQQNWPCSTALRHVVLPAGRGHADLWRRDGAVCRGGRTAARHRDGQPGRPQPPAAPLPGNCGPRFPRRFCGCRLDGALPILRCFEFLDAQGSSTSGHGEPTPAWSSAPGG